MRKITEALARQSRNRTLTENRDRTVVGDGSQKVISDDIVVSFDADERRVTFTMKEDNSSFSFYGRREIFKAAEYLNACDGILAIEHGDDRNS